MKCLKYFFLVGIAVISLSLITVRTSGTSATVSQGNPIPDLGSFTNLSGSTISLSDLKGKKVLVVFWAAYDANSRKDNILFSKMAEKEESPIEMISVSFDKSKSVFEKTIAMDYVDKSNQYYAPGNANSKLIGQLQFEKGFRNCLIDEEGIVLKFNLEPKDLEQYLIRN